VTEDNVPLGRARACPERSVSAAVIRRFLSSTGEYKRLIIRKLLFLSIITEYELKRPRKNIKLYILSEKYFDYVQQK
jgi:hypothetical protein